MPHLGARKGEGNNAIEQGLFCWRLRLSGSRRELLPMFSTAQQLALEHLCDHVHVLEWLFSKTTKSEFVVCRRRRRTRRKYEPLASLAFLFAAAFILGNNVSKIQGCLPKNVRKKCLQLVF
jgi:hypothetical protein